MKKKVDFIKNNLEFVLLSLIGTIVCIMTFKVEIDVKKLHSLFGHTKYIGFFIIGFVCFIISLVIWNIFKKNFKIEKIFLVAIIPIGLMYMFIIPVGRVPDERAHLFRSYEISSGHLIAKKNDLKQGGDYLPKNLNADFKDNEKYIDEIRILNDKASKEKIFFLFPNTSLYCFITYIPQAIGISIGRILNLPLLCIALLGRFTNFLVWVLLMYHSIKLIPFKKFSLLIIMFLPMMLQEAASLSADALTNGIVFLFISYILYLRYNKGRKVSKNDMIIISIITVIMSVCKIVYLPLCLLVFLIPVNKFDVKRKKYIWISVLALVVIIINAFFLLKTVNYVVRTEDFINPGAQIKHILNEPVEFFSVLFRTVYINFHLFTVSFVGEALCWYDVTISPIFTKLLWIIVILVSVLDSFKFKRFDNLFFFLISSIIILLIFLCEYLTWTPVGALSIEGLQGRYFIPLTIPFLILFNLDNLKYDLNRIYKYLLLIMIFINISVLATLFVAHVG